MTSKMAFYINCLFIYILFFYKNCQWESIRLNYWSFMASQMTDADKQLHLSDDTSIKI